MISLLLLTPIVGSILLLPLNENTQQTQIKQIALSTSIVALFISIFIKLLVYTTISNEPHEFLVFKLLH